MKRFKNILVVLNNSPADNLVLERAIELAETNGATLAVRIPVMRAPSKFKRLAGEELQKDFDAYMREKEKKRFDEVREDVQERVARVTVAALEDGDPFIAIVRDVLRKQYDIVLIGDDGPHSVRETFFGTTVAHLLRKCPCPVWAFKRPPAKRSRPGSFRHILAAVDATAEDEGMQLNVKILELATSLATREKAKLKVIHCWTAYGESLMASRGGDEKQLKDYLRSARADQNTAFQKLVEPFREEGFVFDTHMPKGDPGDIIPQLAAKEKIDLVVMGTVARAGISGLLIGNTAEKVLQRLHCSLLAVKPNGFISPVTL